MAFRFFPEHSINILQFLRQTLQRFCLQVRRHTVESFGNAARDAGEGVAIAAKGHRVAQRILIAGAFQKGRDGFRHSLLAGLHMAVTGADLIAGAAQVVAEVPFGIVLDLLFAAAGARQKDGRCRRLPGLWL